MKNKSDGELICAFRLEGEETAFAELMARHGRTVRHAARSVLRDSGAADDIAQAAFLALLGTGAKLEGQQCVAGWLCRVAICLARNECRQRMRRRMREQRAVSGSAAGDESWPTSDVAIEALYEEIAGLADLHRTPIVLHYLEGRSYEDSAAALGCKVNTFGNRLARAREKLKKRLIKRGITGVTMGGLVAMLGQTGEAAEVSAGFVAATCAAAKGGAVSAKVAALTESAMKMLFWAKVQAVTTVCAATVLVGGAGVGAAVTLPLVFRPDVVPAQTQGSSVWTWGNNSHGQFGDGTKTNAGNPLYVWTDTPVSAKMADGTLLNDVVAAACGWYYTMALRADGSVWNWGRKITNQDQPASGVVLDYLLYPVPVKMADGGALSEVAAIAAGGNHGVALRRDHTVWAWGYGNPWGRYTQAKKHFPERVPGLPDIAAIVANGVGAGTNSCALATDSSVWTWGADVWLNGPARVKQLDGNQFLSGVVAISAGNQHTVALKKDGSVWSWGRYDQSGVLANRQWKGRTGAYYQSTSLAVQAQMADGNPLSDVIAIAAGSQFTVAQKADFSIWTWGQLGNPNELRPFESPVEVILPDDVPSREIIAMKCGWDLKQKCGVLYVVTRDGACWSLKNEKICLSGDGKKALQVRATKVNGLPKVISVAPGASHNVVLTK